MHRDIDHHISDSHRATPQHVWWASRCEVEKRPTDDRGRGGIIAIRPRLHHGDVPNTVATVYLTFGPTMSLSYASCNVQVKQSEHKKGVG